MDSKHSTTLNAMKKAEVLIKRQETKDIRAAVYSETMEYLPKLLLSDFNEYACNVDNSLGNGSFFSTISEEQFNSLDRHSDCATIQSQLEARLKANDWENIEIKKVEFVIAELIKPKREEHRLYVKFRCNNWMFYPSTGMQAKIDKAEKLRFVSKEQIHVEQ